MRGRQVLMESLIAHGVECIFGNPGTTESPVLDALLDYPQLRYVVALHEGVALGAASYYAQARGRPAVVNIHVAAASATRSACSTTRSRPARRWW